MLLPDYRVFGDEDVEAAKSMKLFLDAGFADERVDEITRVLGEGMGRLSATIAASFAETFLEAGESEDEVAPRFAELAEQLTPAFAPILVAAFKPTCATACSGGCWAWPSSRPATSPAPRSSRSASPTWSASRGWAARSRSGARHRRRPAGRAGQRVTEPPVRLVKTIGDAAMFVSPEPAPLVEVALELVDAFEEEELPSLRAGIAFGPALQRAGDYYGNSVNLASRVTGVARPGSVLCTREVRDAAARRLRLVVRRHATSSRACRARCRCTARAAQRGERDAEPNASC